MLGHPMTRGLIRIATWLCVFAIRIFERPAENVSFVSAQNVAPKPTPPNKNRTSSKGDLSSTEESYPKPSVLCCAQSGTSGVPATSVWLGDAF